MWIQPWPIIGIVVGTVEVQLVYFDSFSVLTAENCVIVDVLI